MSDRAPNVLAIQTFVKTDRFGERFESGIGAGFENTASGGAFHGLAIQKGSCGG